jgi:hypothetical protein
LLALLALLAFAGSDQVRKLKFLPHPLKNNEL